VGCFPFTGDFPARVAGLKTRGREGNSGRKLRGEKRGKREIENEDRPTPMAISMKELALGRSAAGYKLPTIE